MPQACTILVVFIFFSIEDQSDSTTKVLAKTTGSYSNKSLAKPVKRKIDDKMYYHIDCVKKKVIRRERYKEEED
jgi:hypothetical protein